MGETREKGQYASEREDLGPLDDGPDRLRWFYASRVGDITTHKVKSELLGKRPFNFLLKQIHFGMSSPAPQIEIAPLCSVTETSFGTRRFPTLYEVAGEARILVPSRAPKIAGGL